MNPKEKAYQLFKKYYIDSDILVGYLSKDQAKQSALIAVEEILSTDLRKSPYETIDAYEFWNLVKKELQDL